MKKLKITWVIAPVLLVAGITTILVSQQTAAPGTVLISIIASVEARHHKEVPTINKEDVRVMHDHDRYQVTGWTPCPSEQVGTELFVLIDDATDTDLGSQLEDLKKFIEGQPQTTAIGVGYARNATVQIAQNLTRDHAQAGKGLRLPIGLGATASPYLSLIELLKAWPQGASCRQVLMISSGIDFFQGGPNDSYLLEAIDQAQRAAVQVYAIDAPAPGHAAHSFWRINWGQNNLSRLTEETGGEFYIQGLSPPIAFAPYLTQYSERLSQQFKLTFLAKRGNKADYQHIKLETEVPNAELVAQDRVYVPALR